MVAIVAGAGLGLLDTSLTTIGPAGVAGESLLGQGSNRAMLNVANGNLVLQAQDGQLAGCGTDLLALRTYNSLAAATAPDGDGWRWSYEQTVQFQGPGDPAQALAGATVIRTGGDGHETAYVADPGHAVYLSAERTGLPDELRYDGAAAEWVWTGGITRRTERYSDSTGPGMTGRILRCTDPSGNDIAFGYEAGHIATIRDATSQQELRLTYQSSDGLTRLQRLEAISLIDDADGQPTPVVGDPVRIAEYNHDDAGRLIAVTRLLDPAAGPVPPGPGFTTTYSYDGPGSRLAAVTQSDGTAVSFSYDAAGRVSAVRDGAPAAGIQLDISYDALLNNTSVTDGTGQVSTYRHDPVTGRLTGMTALAVGGTSPVTSFGYDAAGNLASIQNADDNTITFGYDLTGNRVLERDAAGNTTTRTFSPDNLVVTESRYRIADPDGSGAQAAGDPITTRYVYDPAARLRFLVSPEGRVTEHRYGAPGSGFGLLVGTILYVGTLFDVTALGPAQQLTETDLTEWVAALPDRTQVELTEYRYDLRGNMSRQVGYATVDAAGGGVLDAGAGVMDYLSDAYSLLRERIAVRGGTRDQRVIESHAEYDGMAREVSRRGADGLRTTRYDDAGQQVVVTTTAGLTETREYDTRHRLTRIRLDGDATTRETRFVHDAADRLRMIKDAQGGQRYRFYDPAGRLAFTVDATGAVTGLEHDPAGRLTRQTQYANRAGTGGWYDEGAGTVTKSDLGVSGPGSDVVVDPAHDRVTSYAYDGAGRLILSTDAVGTATAVSYDGLSRVTMTGTSDRVTRYLYDRDGRRTGMVDALGYLVEYRYDVGGRLVETIRYSLPSPLPSAGDDQVPDWRPDGTGARHSYFFHDGRGRVVGTVDEQQGLTESVYDEEANTLLTLRYPVPVSVEPGDDLASVRSRAGVPSRPSFVRYDDFGRVLESTSLDGSVTRTEYDEAGRPARVVSAAGTDQERVRSTFYNAFGEIRATLAGEGSAWLGAGPSAQRIEQAIREHGTRYAHDTLGRVVLSVDPDGATTLRYYDRENRPTHTVDAVGDGADHSLSGEVSETIYTSFGQPETIRQYATRLDESAMDELMAEGGGLAGPSLLGRLAGVADGSRDEVTSFEYDRCGRLLRQVDGENCVTQNAYTVHGELAAQTRSPRDGETTTTRFDYDLAGRLVARIRDADGIHASTTTEYDAFGRVVRTVDATGRATVTDYPDSGRSVVVADALQQARQTEYDLLGRVVRVTDPLGARTGYAYDDGARTVTGTSPEGRQVTTLRGRHGETRSVTDARGNEIRYEYDRDGRPASVTDALGQVIARHAYSPGGRLLESADASGTVTRFTYDRRNRVVERRIDPGGLDLATRFEVDALGRQVAVIDAADTAAARLTRFEYDRKGRLTGTVVDAAAGGLGLTTRYRYDGLDDTVEIARGTLSSPGEHVIYYEYDSLQRRVREVVAPGARDVETRYRYAAADNLTRRIDPNGNSTWYVYDPAGRLIQTISPLGDVTENGYDAAGRAIATRSYLNRLALATVAGLGDVVDAPQAPVATSDDDRSRVVLDADGQARFVLRSAGPVGWTVVETRYDENGNAIETRAYDRLLPQDRVAALDPAGQGVTPTEIHDELRGTLGYRDEDPDTLARVPRTFRAYDADDRLRFSVDPTGAVTENVWDAGGNRIAVVRYAARPVLTDHTEAAIAVAVDRADPANRTTRYAYDAAGRLRYTVDGLDSVTENVYGERGNLTRTVLWATRPALTEYTETAIARALDAVPDPQVDQITHFAHDAGDRLRFAVDATGAITEHAYNAVGDLVATTRYARRPVPAPGSFAEQDLLAVVDALDADPATQTTHHAYDSARRLRFTVDPLGSVTESISDANGNLIARTRFAQRPGLVQYDEAAIAAAVGALSADPRNRTVRFVHDALNRLRFTVDALGGVTEQMYDALGRVVSTERFAGRPLLAGYTETDLDTAVAPLRGQAGNRIEHRFHDPLGQIRIGALRVSLAGGQGRYQVTAQDVDALGRVASRTVHAAAVTPAAIDEASIMAAVVSDPDRDRTSFHRYDLAGRRTHVLDAVSPGPDGIQYRVRTQHFDALGQAIANVTCVSAVTVDPSDPAAVDAAVQAAADPARDQRSAVVLDVLGQPTHTLRALGEGSCQVTVLEYDTFGRPFRITQVATAVDLLDDLGPADRPAAAAAAVAAAAGPDDRIVQYVYDVAGRQRFVLQADRVGQWTISESRYDVVGNVTETRRYDRLAPDSWVASVNAARLSGVREQDVIDRLVALGYDEADPVTLATIQVTRFVYDRQNRVRFTIDALGGTAENVYDALGDLRTTIRYATYPEPADLSEAALDAAVDRTDPGNRIQHTVYDALGQSRFDVQVFEPDTGTGGRHGITERRYDALGQLVDTRAYATPAGHLDSYDEQVIAATVIADSARDRHAVVIHDEGGRPVYGLRGLRAGPDDRYVVTRQQHDALGQLVQRVEHASPAAVTSFDAAAVESTLVPDRTNDRVTTYVRDAAGRLRFQIRPDRTVRESVYDALDQLVEMRQFEITFPSHDPGTEADMAAARGSRHVGDGVTRGLVHAYDAAGRCVQITDAAGLAEQHEYDALGSRVRSTDRNGQVWRYVYDRAGQLTVQTTPPTAFALPGEDVTVAPPERVIETRFEYDAFHNLVSQAEAANFDADAATTQFQYDTLGRPAGTVLPSYYDPAIGTVERDPAPGRFRRESSILYDELGDAVRIGSRRTEDAADYTYRTYDARGQIVHEVNALGHVTRYTANAFGEQQTVTRHSVTLRGTPQNGTHWTVAEVETQLNLGHDELGRLIEDVYARTIRTAYDTLGRKSTVTLPEATYYSTQTPGDPAQVDGFRLTPQSVTGVKDAGTTTYEYNAFGDLTRQRVRANTVVEWQETSFSYDVMGRRTRGVDAAGSATELSYDTAGNLVLQSEPTDEPGTDRTTQYGYDVLDRQTRVDRYRLRYTDAAGEHGVVTWTPDNGGTWLDPDGDVATTVRATGYDPYGRPVTVTDAAGNVLTMRYDPFGHLVEVAGSARTFAPVGANGENAVDPFRDQLATVLVTAMTLDAFGRAVRQVRATAQGQDAREIRQAYDHGGNLLSTTDAEGNAKHQAFDAAGRVIRQTQALRAELGPLGGNEQGLERRYHYDAIGQVTSTLDVYLDGSDPVQSGKAVLYNAFGEVTEERRSWGAADQPPEALTTARSAWYHYDNAGHVFEKVAADGLTLYYYNLLSQVTREEKRGNSHPADGGPRVTEYQYDVLGRPTMIRRPVFSADVTPGTGTTVRPVTPYLLRSLDRWGNAVATQEGGYEFVNGQVSYPQFRIFVTNQYDSNDRLVAEYLGTYGSTGANGVPANVLLSRRTFRDLLGNAIQERDEAREPQTEEVLSSRTRRKEYDPAGAVTAEIDATGRRLEYAYNVHGERLGTRNAHGTVLFNRYDRTGNIRFHGVLRTSSPAGAGEYDSRAGTGTIVRTYLNAYLYDQAGRRVAGKTFTEEADQPWSYTWLDGRNLGVRHCDVMGVITGQRFDPFGNKCAEIDGAGGRWEWTAATADDEVGRITAYRQPVDGGGTRFGQYTYNGFGEIKIHEVGNTMTEFDRHENGMISNVTITPDVTQAGVREMTQYQYDARGQLTMEGRLAPDSVQTTMISYDTNGRPARVEQSKVPFGASCDVTYDYDEWSNIRRVRASYTHTGADTPSVTESWYDFDAAGRMTLCDGALSSGAIRLKVSTAGSVLISYDEVGRRSGVTEYVRRTTDPHQSARPWDTMRDEQYEYDDLGHLRQIQQRIRQIGLVPVDDNGNGHGHGHPPPVPQDFIGSWQMLSARSPSLRGDVLRSQSWTHIRGLPHDPETDQASQLLSTTLTSYRADGQVASTQADAVDPKNSTRTENIYDPQTGQLASYTFHAFRSDGVRFTATFDYQHTFQNGARAVHSIRDQHNGLDTVKTYDLLGRLIAERVDLQKPNGPGSDRYEARTYRYAGDDRIIFKDADLRLSSSGPDTVPLPTPTDGQQTYVYAGNRLAATIGSLRLEQATKFDFTYTPMSEVDGSGGSRYVVQNGDSLTDIALAGYGDGALWYVVADANGITSGPDDPLPSTEVGKAYDLPDVVRSSHAADTYVPFGISQVIGNDRPIAIPPPPPPRHSDIELMTVAAVSLTLQIGATVILTDLGVPAPIAYGIGAGLGNLGSQATSWALDIQGPSQHGIDWGGVGTAAAEGLVFSAIAGASGLAAAVSREVWHQASSGAWRSGGGLNWTAIAGSVMAVGADAFGSALGGPSYGAFDVSVAGLVNSAFNPGTGWAVPGGGRSPVVGVFEFAYGAVANGLVNLGYGSIRQLLEQPTAPPATPAPRSVDDLGPIDPKLLDEWDRLDREQVRREDEEALAAANDRITAASNERLGWLLQVGAMADRNTHFGEDLNDRALVAAARRQMNAERIEHERAVAQAAREAWQRRSANFDALIARAATVDPQQVEYNRLAEENDSGVLQDMYRSGYYVYVSRATNVDGLIVNRSGGMAETMGPLSMSVVGMGDDLRGILQDNSRALAGEQYVLPQEIVEIHDLNTPAAQSRRLGLADVQTFAEFTRTYAFTHHTREGVQQAFLQYHNQRSDRIVENWRHIDNAGAAVNLIARATLVGIQAIVDPVGALAPLTLGYGTQKVLTMAGVDPDTAAMAGHLAGTAVAIGYGLSTDPVGTAVSFAAGDATTLVLRAAGVSDEDAGLLGGAAGTMVGFARTFGARGIPLREILNAQRSWRTESDALGRDFENSRDVPVSDDVPLYQRVTPGATFDRPADAAPGVLEAPATLAPPPATASPAGRGLVVMPGPGYSAPGEYAVVPYEQSAMPSRLQRIFDGDFTPRSGLVAYASSDDGGFQGGGDPGGPETPSALVLPRSGQLLLPAGRQRGTLIDPGPSEEAITLGPGRLGLDRIGSNAFRRRVEPWVGAVLSNRPFSWESIGLGWLDNAEREIVRIRSLELGLVPRIPVDRVTDYADFSSVLIDERTLPEELWQLSDDEQFRYLDDLIGGRESGMTWHHHELPGWMQLVPFGPHNITSHFGGRSPGQWAYGNR